jgi:adenylate kinase family enzyme
VVTQRLEIYNREAEPLLDYYRDQGLVVDFHVKQGMKDVPEVLALLEKNVN